MIEGIFLNSGVLGFLGMRQQQPYRIMRLTLKIMLLVLLLLFPLVYFSTGTITMTITVINIPI